MPMTAHATLSNVVHLPPSKRSPLLFFNTIARAFAEEDEMIRDSRQARVAAAQCGIAMTTNLRFQCFLPHTISHFDGLKHFRHPS